MLEPAPLHLELPDHHTCSSAGLAIILGVREEGHRSGLGELGCRRVGAGRSPGGQRVEACPALGQTLVDDKLVFQVHVDCALAVYCLVVLCVSTSTGSCAEGLLWVLFLTIIFQVLADLARDFLAQRKSRRLLQGLGHQVVPAPTTVYPLDNQQPPRTFMQIGRLHSDLPTRST